MSIILSYLFYFIASTAASLQERWITKKRDLESNAQIKFVFQVIFILFLGSLSFPFFSPFYLAGNPIHLFLLVLACGIFGTLCNITRMVAQKHLDAGVSIVVLNVYTPIAIVLSSVLLHEGLSIMQIYGTLLLLAAMVIVSKKHRISRFKFNKYFVTMILSGIFLGFLLVAERWLQKMTGFSAGIMLSWGAQALGLGIATLLTKSKHTYTDKEVLVSGVFRFFGSLSYVVLVYVVANLSLVMAVTTFKIVVVALAAAIFLNEREDLDRKIFGSIIAIIGLFLMR